VPLMAIIARSKFFVRIILFACISVLSLDVFSFSRPPSDTDGDGIIDSSDLCIETPIGESVDNNGCAASQRDSDGDGYSDAIDAFPSNANEWSDLDSDGIGDNSDEDRDGDGINNSEDLFPNNSAESSDLDGDGIGDNADTDIDGDGVNNSLDAFPYDPSETADLDYDGIGDNSDIDIDGDGTENTLDAFPRDETETADFDSDGIGNNADDDDDNDSIPDVDDLRNQIISSVGGNISEVSEYLFDEFNNLVYLTHKAARSLSVIDAEKGLLVKSFTFDNMPESMSLSTDGNTLYVALLTQEHSSYLQDEDQNGFIAVINTQQVTLTKTLTINIDPYDLLITSEGKLIVSSGSGQWTNIYAYDANTGDILGNSRIRQRSRLSLHPSENWVFAANTDLSPADIEKFDISGFGITSIGNSPYHGEHRMEGNIWSLPSGEHVITRGGDIFLAADMTYVSSLLETGIRINDIYFDHTKKISYLLLSNNEVQLLNLKSLEIFRTIAFTDELATAYSIGSNSYYITETEDEVTLIKEPHPCLECDTNTAPIASFSYSPIAGDTSDTYTFDARNSSDIENGSSMQYRWDLDNDGNWDSSFSSNAIFSHKFLLAGTKTIRLQVKDTNGLTAIYVVNFDVSQGTESGTAITDGVPFNLPFSATDVVTDKLRSRAYVTDSAAKRLYVIDLTTGITEKYFDFEYQPERLTMSSDSSRLYVALLTHEHSSTRSEEDQSGFIAVFDLDTQNQIKNIAISTDPYDLVATNSGKLVVSSGSGQWTGIYTYDVDTGETLGKTVIRQKSRLSLHPSEDWVFAANTDSSPSDIEKFDISGDSITSISDSPYHGDYRMNGDVWASPDGTYVITRGGDIFLASDMSYVESLTASGVRIQELSFNEENKTMTLLGSDGSIYRYDSSTWQLTGLIDGIVSPQFILESSDATYTISGDASTKLLELLIF